MTCQGMNSVYTIATPRRFGSQRLVLTKHLDQANHMAWQMAHHQGSNAVAIDIAERFNYQIILKIANRTSVGNVDIPDLFAVVIDGIHDINRQFQFMQPSA